MAPTARLPPKKDVALALLEQASMYIHLDPRTDAVKVPAWFKKQPQLVLQVGLNMAVPIPDLHVDEQGLSCTLSFNRAPFYCMIPWPAVFALVGENGQAMVWAEDVPAEVAAQAQRQREPEKPRTHLRSVGDGEGAPSPAVKPAPAKSDAAKRADKKTVSTKSSKGAKLVAKPAAGERPRTKAGAKAKVEAKTTASTAGKVGASQGKARAKLGEARAKLAEAKAPPKKPEARPEPAAAMAPAQPKPEAARAASELSKPKRELPPYLRVVK